MGALGLGLAPAMEKHFTFTSAGAQGEVTAAIGRPVLGEGTVSSVAIIADVAAWAVTLARIVLIVVISLGAFEALSHSRFIPPALTLRGGDCCDQLVAHRQNDAARPGEAFADAA